MNDQEIKKVIAEYIQVDDEINEINKKVKEIRTKKKNLEETIKSYMETEGISKVELPTGSLKISKSTTQKKVGKQEMVPILIDLDISDTTVNKIVEELFEEESEEKTKVVRSKK